MTGANTSTHDMSDAGMTGADVRRYIEDQEAAYARRVPELAFTRDEYRRRLDVIRAGMAAAGLDVLVLTAPDTTCWLHGYTARWYRIHSSSTVPMVHCTVVHADRDPMFMLEQRYHEGLVRQTSCVEDLRPVDGGDMDREPSLVDFVQTLARHLGSEGWLGGAVGLERWSCVPSPAVSDAVEGMLASHGCRVVDATATIRSARRLKSAAEIVTIERAQVAVDAGLRALQRSAAPGMTELEGWNHLMTGMIAAGGEPTAIHETVSAGPPMPTAHALSSRRPISRGEVFHADAAGAVDRYHARATRPFFFGEPPPPMRRLVEVAAGAYEVLSATAQVGTPFVELNRTLRAYYREAGVDGSACGYELGISFMPDWVGEFTWSIDDETTDAVIEPGLVTNFESIAFVALIDTVVFTENGPRLLSTLPRTTLVVDDAR